MIYGEKDGIEHVVQVIERVHTFTSEERLLNIDDIIPFSEINPRTTIDSSNMSQNCYLIGSNKNGLRMHIIITPLTKFCSTFSPHFVFK